MKKPPNLLGNKREKQEKIEKKRVQGLFCILNNGKLNKSALFPLDSCSKHDF